MTAKIVGAEDMNWLIKCLFWHRYCVCGTVTEKNHSQIEKEAFELVFAVKKPQVPVWKKISPVNQCQS
ncbi:unnamed protein product [Haemonchus placei]|uniref:Mobile element protein n=1 Tax=Haemonchus placei TaxID=6290 RepID=A0A0N4WEH7_HAEPC|nr:unnamed protein product [Haemonchus placei]